MLKSLTKALFETEFKPELALEQCFVRNFLHALVVVATLIAQYFDGIGELHDLVVILGITYITLSALSTALVYHYHHLAKTISITGVITDTFIICFIMYMGGDKEATLYGLLIFLVIANGLRFGKAHMQFANIVCIIGFLILVLFNDYWQSHTLLSIGNLIWLILIPAHLTNLLTHLEQAVKKAESANTAKTLFLANMSHEIRTPLTSIIGYAQSLLNNNQSSIKKSDAITAIIRNGEHLSTIVNDILDISKMEADKLEIEKREFSLIELIREVELLFRQRIESKHLIFRINYQLPLPETIISDSLRIKQILINLCSNSLKFTEDGEIAININFNAEDSLILITVSDTGIGLSHSQSSDLFSNFTQADSSTTREYGGTGLGLSISSKLAELLGGKLWVESILGKGSQFHLNIPLSMNFKPNLLSELPPENINTMIIDNTTSNATGTILLVEDVVDNQVLISSLLEDMGANVEIAENGLVALSKVSEKKYDLILLDLQMPLMGGKEALKEMRRKGYSSPVVFLTANVIQNEEKESVNLKCQGFLSKPIDKDKLKKVVNTYLSITNIVTPKRTNKPITTPNNSNIILSSLLDEEDTDKKYMAIAKTFSLQLHDRINEIESAFKTKNFALLRELIHNLKGLGGNMGYEIITELSRETENALLLKKYNTVADLILELYRAEKKILAGFDL